MSAADASESSPGGAPAPLGSDVRLVTGALDSQELAAVAVVISAMSVTSRLEAEERSLLSGGGEGIDRWSDPARLPAPVHASAQAWQFGHR